MSTVGFYIPSYKRSDRILTHKLADYATYVVRESEREKYEKAGVKVWSVADDLIVGIPKVQNYIIDNAKEDLIVIMDDDIKNFIYRIESNEILTDADVIYDEIMRMAQIVYDLDIGYMSVPNDVNPKFYSSEFKFCGITGQMRIINRKKCKSRFNEIDFLNDIDFELQELLHNRIILIPSYFGVNADIDTNSGGSNDRKTLEKFYIANEMMKNKWGVYYKEAEDGKPGRLNVKR